MKRSLIFSITLALLFVLALFTTASAQEGDPSTITDDQVNAIAKQLYCPVCENIPLDVCGTQACAQWRELIREKLALGWSEEQIKDYFVLQYGDRVLAEPPRRGLNWLVYIVPPVVVIAGGFTLVYYLRKMKKPAVIPAEPVGSEQAVQQDEYESRFEEALKKRY